MGEAKAKRARLADVLGETRGESYEALLDDLQKLKPQTESERDRVVFIRLFATAVVEGLNTRVPDGVSGERTLELFGNIAVIAGSQIGVYAMQCIDDHEPTRLAFANALMMSFAQGMSIALRQPIPDETP